MANLFDKVKNSEPKKEEKHEIVNLPELEPSVVEMVKLNAKIAELEAKRTVLDSEIRNAGKEALVNLYNSKKIFPGTLKVVAGQGNFQFITSDRYKKIDKDRYDELAKTYGENIVEEETTYSFDTAILMKYKDHISDLLMNSTVISSSDKENLLNCETSLTVKKGTIKNLFSSFKIDSVDNIVEDIQPVFSIKSVQVTK